MPLVTDRRQAGGTPPTGMADRRVARVDRRQTSDQRRLRRERTLKYVEDVRKHVGRLKTIAAGQRDFLAQMSKADWAALLADPARLAQMQVANDRLHHTLTTTVTDYAHASVILREVVTKDFVGKHGLSAFGFGVGYGTFLHLLKWDADLRHTPVAGTRRRVSMFDPKQLGGVELQSDPLSMTRQRKLNVLHGLRAEELFEPDAFEKVQAVERRLTRDEFAARTRPRDMTYSIDFLNMEILDRIAPAAREKIVENIARMTKVGGYSYHVMSGAPRDHQTAMTRVLFERHGFEVEYWGPSVQRNATLIKLRRVS